MTLTIQEKCLEWNGIAEGINLFGFQANWLIFFFGDKLKRKKCICFHLWISHLCICAVPLFSSTFFRHFVLHEHSAWKCIIDVVTWLEDVPDQKGS